MPGIKEARARLTRRNEIGRDRIASPPPASSPLSRRTIISLIILHDSFGDRERP